MDENATPHATDDADPSPFRRFPYVQLVLCLACLTMAGWTWMRYSWQWEVRPRDFYNYEGSEAAKPGVMPWVAERFVRLHGTASDIVCRIPTGDRKGYVCQPSEHQEEYPVPVTLSAGEPQPELLLLGRARVESLPSFSNGAPLHYAYLDTTASRFHPASIAGIVAGAMGVFIFGLYLRRWVKERKADFTTEAQSAQRTT